MRVRVRVCTRTCSHSFSRPLTLLSIGFTQSLWQSASIEDKWHSATIEEEKLLAQDLLLIQQHLSVDGERGGGEGEGGEEGERGGRGKREWGDGRSSGNGKGVGIEGGSMPVARDRVLVSWCKQHSIHHTYVHYILNVCTIVIASIHVYAHRIVFKCIGQEIYICM